VVLWLWLCSVLRSDVFLLCVLCAYPCVQYLTRQGLAAAGLPTPRNARISKPDDIEPAGHHVGFPSVIKPVSGGAGGWGGGWSVSVSAGRYCVRVGGWMGGGGCSSSGLLWAEGRCKEGHWT
jgi:hypothetical protein